MYSLKSTSLLLMKRCPITHITTASRYTITNMKCKPLRVTCSFKENKYEDDTPIRNYVSVGGNKNKNFNFPNMSVKNIICQSKQILKEVQLSELSNAPKPAFWFGVAGLAPFVLPPMSFLLFGYSPFLAGIQMTFGATICSFLGGMKWLEAVNEHNENYEPYAMAVLPQVVAWLSLLLPHTFGFIMLSGGLLASAFIDLTTGNYPPWFRALRLGLTIPAVIGLLLSALFALFH